MASHLSFTPSQPYLYDLSDEDIQEFLPLSKRKRSSRACDQCRKTKSRCERVQNSSICINCFNTSSECTFLGPNRKRGPPKGYIVDLELHVHRLESILGVILSSTDPGVRSLIEVLSEDQLARNIITEVERGPFGPLTRGNLLYNGQPKSNLSERNTFVSSRDRREQRVVGGHYELDSSLPSYQWQNKLIMRLNSSNMMKSSFQNRIPESDSEASYALTPEIHYNSQSAGLSSPSVVNPLPNLGMCSLATKRPNEAAKIWKTLYDTSPRSSSRASSYESDDDPADAIGQLSLNEKEEVGYLGKTSGMHLLAKPRRKDNLLNRGIWNLPQSRYWPISERGGPMVEEDLKLDIELPPEHIQDNLLSLYWTYVQPILPVIDKEKFLEELRTERKTSRKKIPRLLILAMFTIATRYTDYYPPPPQGEMWVAGCDMLDQARYILNWTYDSSRPSACQALILLAYREFGVGAIPRAWLYMGMAIRMATDLGIHRSSDHWQLNDETLLSETEKSLRKRIWHCCVLLDRIMAFVMGRPMCIRERDYDAPLPDLDKNEEYEVWFPRGVHNTHNKQRTCYTLSTLHATSSLSSILDLVVDTIYACRSGVGFSIRHVESFKIATHLKTWYDQLPRHLKYFAREDPVPPPHILTLHMMYWCVVLLAHRPFIQVHASAVTDSERAQMSEKSLLQSQNAASKISDLVAIYRHTWGLSCANAYLGWLVLTSGIMHVATLVMKLNNQPEARKGLQHCLDALEEMKVVWPSSERALQLLGGAEIDTDALTNREQFDNDSYRNQISPNCQSNANAQTLWSTQPSDLPSFFTSMLNVNNTDATAPAELSYFPGYEHWPPESLVYQSAPYYGHENQNFGKS